LIKHVHQMAEVARQVHDGGVGDHQQHNQQNAVWRVTQSRNTWWHSIHKLCSLTLQSL